MIIYDSAILNLKSDL